MFQPKIIIRWKDSVTGALGWLVIDRLINGVCGGGTFMHAAATEKEVTELAHTMSYKNALQHIPFGGAKAGICFDHTRPEASHVLARFLYFLKPWLETVWCTGADLNTSNAIMQTIINSMGLTSMFSPLGKMIAHRYKIEDQSDKIFSRMRLQMTPYFTLSEGATGYSVALVISMIFKNKRPRIFIQGFGSVGRSLSYFLHYLNIGTVVGICDIDGLLYAEEGIDSIEILNTFRSADAKENESIDRWLPRALKEKYNYQKRSSHSDEDFIIQSVTGKKLDVFSPCASRYAVTHKVIKAMAEQNNELHIIAGANNVFDSAITLETALKKGIRCFPEWISNCGTALLYEELLSIDELPNDYNSILQETIKARILSFLHDTKPETQDHEHWHELFIRTAEHRMAHCKKMMESKPNDTINLESIDTK